MQYKYLFILIAFSACTAAKLSVPGQFSSQTTKHPVKGINGWQVNQRLNFGNYHTSKIKRGWDFTASVQYTRFSIRPEDMLLKVFNINTDNNRNTQRGKFQYTLEDGNNVTEIYATEKFNEKQLIYKSDSWLGNVSRTNRYEYAFTAAIVPVTIADYQPWSLVLLNKYDAANDTGRGIFDRPYVEEEGYATNGKEKIMIRPLRIEKVTTASGKQTKVFGGKLLSGYELRWDDGVVGIVDILDNNVWIVNELEPKEKLILASVSSALLLKRMQDVEKDKESFDK